MTVRNVTFNAISCQWTVLAELIAVPWIVSSRCQRTRIDRRRIEAVGKVRFACRNRGRVAKRPRETSKFRERGFNKPITPMNSGRGVSNCSRLDLGLPLRNRQCADSSRSVAKFFTLKSSRRAGMRRGSLKRCIRSARTFSTINAA